MGWRLGHRASKCACLIVLALFQADLGMNLIKQGGNVKGRPCGSVGRVLASKSKGPGFDIFHRLLKNLHALAGD